MTNDHAAARSIPLEQKLEIHRRSRSSAAKAVEELREDTASRTYSFHALSIFFTSLLVFLVLPYASQQVLFIVSIVVLVIVAQLGLGMLVGRMLRSDDDELINAELEAQAKLEALAYSGGRRFYPSWEHPAPSSR